MVGPLMILHNCETGIAECHWNRNHIVGDPVENYCQKALQPEFGAYRGLARVSKSPSKPQNCRKKEQNLEKGTPVFCAKLWYAPNPGSEEI